jgi:hypothetical protein
MFLSCPFLDQRSHGGVMMSCEKEGGVGGAPPIRKGGMRVQFSLLARVGRQVGKCKHRLLIINNDDDRSGGDEEGEGACWGRRMGGFP